MGLTVALQADQRADASVTNYDRLDAVLARRVDASCVPARRQPQAGGDTRSSQRFHGQREPGLLGVSFWWAGSVSV